MGAYLRMQVTQSCFELERVEGDAHTLTSSGSFGVFPTAFTEMENLRVCVASRLYW